MNKDNAQELFALGVMHAAAEGRLSAKALAEILAPHRRKTRDRSCNKKKVTAEQRKSKRVHAKQARRQNRAYA